MVATEAPSLTCIAIRAETKGQFLPGGSFCKGARVPIGRFQVGGRGWFSKGQRGQGLVRVGDGVGTGKETGKSMRTHLSKLPFSKLPFSFSRTLKST